MLVDVMKLLIYEKFLLAQVSLPDVVCLAYFLFQYLLKWYSITNAFGCWYTLMRSAVQVIRFYRD